MNQEEKHDIIPEIWEGHNIADYIDPEIMKVNGMMAVVLDLSWVLMSCMKNNTQEAAGPTTLLDN